MRIAAHWARVALPCGASVSALMPVMTPLSIAQLMASAAQSLTLPASDQALSGAVPSGSPA